MEGIPTNLSEYPLAIALLILGGFAVRYFLRREDEKEAMRQQRDEAYLQTLAAIQQGVVAIEKSLQANWVMSEAISKSQAVMVENQKTMVENQAATTSALVALRCLKKT